MAAFARSPSLTAEQKAKRTIFFGPRPMHASCASCAPHLPGFLRGFFRAWLSHGALGVGEGGPAADEDVVAHVFVAAQKRSKEALKG